MKPLHEFRTGHQLGLILAFLTGCAVLGQSCAVWAADPPRPTGPIEFNRDIRPILSDNCYQCHGPDSVQRKAGLRLDTEAGATVDLGGRRAVVSGHADQSEMFLRLITTEAEERMPPQSSGKQLTPAQINLIRDWINQGAVWQKHWAFIPPKSPKLPSVVGTHLVRNPIDQFVLARLEQVG
ncbi:MAG: hypothetical protein JSS02_20510, partial [Planctomycetes bacterium]|nr:hypothetical protein [Planctomycetota bacterium]